LYCAYYSRIIGVIYVKNNCENQSEASMGKKRKEKKRKTYFFYLQRKWRDTWLVGKVRLGFLGNFQIIYNTQITSKNREKGGKTGSQTAKIIANYSGVQSKNNVYHIVDKVQNTLKFDLIDNVVYVVFTLYSSILEF
jgi:hypothetical protein